MLDAANQEPGLPLQEKELEQLLRFLRNHDLIAASDPLQRRGYALKAAARRVSLWKTLLHQYLFSAFRYGVRTRCSAVAGRCCNVTACLCCAWYYRAYCCWGGFLVSRDWVRYTQTFPHMFSLQGMAVFGMALVFAKFFHELGHAFMAKRAGCRVQTMGVAFIVLFPCFIPTSAMH